MVVNQWIKVNFQRNIYQCIYGIVCGLMYNDGSNVKIHMENIHDQMFENKCVLCGIMYSDRSNVKIQMNNLHI